jgi:hypothetical protein
MNRDSMWAGRLYAELGTLDDILTVGVTERARNLYAELSREHGGKPDDPVRLPWNALCLACEQQDDETAEVAASALLAALQAEFDLNPTPRPVVTSGGPVAERGTATEAVTILREEA